MDTLQFYQTIAAVIVGQALFAVTLYALRRIHRHEQRTGREDHDGRAIPYWLRVLAILPMAIVAVAAATLR